MDAPQVTKTNLTAICTYPICTVCYFKEIDSQKYKLNNKRIVRRMRKSSKEDWNSFPCTICTKETYANCSTYVLPNEISSSEAQKNYLEIFNNRASNHKSIL